MAEKRTPNKIMIIIAVGIVVLFIFVLMSKRTPRYSQIRQLPSYEEASKPKDGDTQADTIRALQAYAKEAVGKAERLNDETRQQQTTVLENRNKVSKLENANKALIEATEKMTQYAQGLEKALDALRNDMKAVKEEQKRSQGTVDENGIPVGFGFDQLQKKHSNEVGQWHEPIDRIPEDEGGNSTGFTGLLTPPGKTPPPQPVSQPKKAATPEITEVPYLTIPKDTVLYDGIALTALIGRIPVEGITPDPYPVKIIIGKESLAANGHALPEVEGMIFSGVGIGDWNLSCISVRLYSATYIFEDGSIVNHSRDAKPLGYVSDQKGWPCVAGEFKTNAPKFLRDRIGLAGMNAAGTAYANAQFTRHQNATSGDSNTSFTGSLDKLLAGSIVQSATEEASQWITDRQKQSFDAVIADPGADVSIHIEETIVIDQSDMNRKLRYSSMSKRAERTLD